MRLYQHHNQHRFYCGIDMHARTLYLHVLDVDGQTRYEKNIPARPDAFPDAVQPFRDGLVVGVECMFNVLQPEGLTSLSPGQSAAPPWVNAHTTNLHALKGRHRRCRPFRA